MRRELGQFLEEVERRTGRTAVVYATPEAKEAILGEVSRPLWFRSIAREPRIPWAFWQFDAAGRLKGVARPVDLDVFDGTLAELDAL